ncbi:MAG: hypothetical protein JXQ96_02630 [Cyclobacteriaceae bacterium]
MSGYSQFVKSILGLSVLLLVSLSLHAQSQSSIEEFIPTRKVDKKIKEDLKKNRPKRQKLMYIYKRRTNGTLYGNPCALDVTQKMGFEYLAQETSKIDLKSYWGRFFHNLWTKTKLVARRGPWWKLTVNKRIRDCQSLTGDRTG